MRSPVVAIASVIVSSTLVASTTPFEREDLDWIVWNDQILAAVDVRTGKAVRGLMEVDGDFLTSFDITRIPGTDDSVFVTYDNEFARVSLPTWDELWRNRSLAGNARDVFDLLGVSISTDRLVLQSDNEIVAASLEGGRIVWRARRNEEEPLCSASIEGRHIVHVSASKTVCRSLLDGRTLWETDGGVAAVPLGGESGFVLYDGTTLRRMDVEGAVVWARRLACASNDDTAIVRIAGSRVFTSHSSCQETGTSCVHATDLTTGDRGARISAGVLTDALASSDGSMQVVHVTSDDSSPWTSSLIMVGSNGVQWRRGARCTSVSWIWENDRLYVSEYFNSCCRVHLRCIDIADGQTVWDADARGFPHWGHTLFTAPRRTVSIHGDLVVLSGANVEAFRKYDGELVSRHRIVAERMRPLRVP